MQETIAVYINDVVCCNCYKKEPKYSEGKQNRKILYIEESKAEHVSFEESSISVSQEQDKVLEVQAWLVYLEAFFIMYKKVDLNELNL